LVIQGLTLLWLIRKVNMEDKFTPIPEYRQEAIIQKKIAQVSLNYLQEKYSGEVMKNERLNNLIERLQIDINSFQQDFEAMTNTTDSSLSSYQRMYLELLEHQRKLLNAMNNRTEFDEELIRKYLSLIDLEEFKIREKLVQEATE
jgi:monovalent cation/hydrogen antiporter